MLLKKVKGLIRVIIPSRFVGVKQMRTRRRLRLLMAAWRVLSCLSEYFGYSNVDLLQYSLVACFERAEQQKERRRLRAMLGRDAGEDSDSEDEFMAKTGGVFSRGCKQVTMTGGGGSEAAIQDAILFK